MILFISKENCLNIFSEFWNNQTIDIPSKPSPWYLALSIPNSTNFASKMCVMVTEFFPCEERWLFVFICWDEIICFVLLNKQS